MHDRFQVFILYYRLSFGSLCACAIGSGQLICIMFFVFFIFSYASPWRRNGVTFPTSCVVVVVFALVLSISSTLSTHYYLPSHLCCVPRIEIRGTRPPYFLPLLSESRWPGVWGVFFVHRLFRGLDFKFKEILLSNAFPLNTFSRALISSLVAKPLGSLQCFADLLSSASACFSAARTRKSTTALLLLLCQSWWPGVWNYLFPSPTPSISSLVTTAIRFSSVLR